MKLLIPACFFLCGAASFATFAAQSSKNASREIIGSRKGRSKSAPYIQ